eukprot:TRINITY_DN2409_c0_g1_i2.p1 TRINITY_DN2409_c0_g1~~TRINITY_DN2409_c0_g1_i2.p1  ORF type:complete len:517 (+),score=124.95 TRINITY_DN2409_c0_g1_i2:133-1551(+)
MRTNWSFVLFVGLIGCASFMFASVKIQSLHEKLSLVSDNYDKLSKSFDGLHKELSALKNAQLEDKDDSNIDELFEAVEALQRQLETVGNERKSLLAAGGKADAVQNELRLLANNVTKLSGDVDEAFETMSADVAALGKRFQAMETGVAKAQDSVAQLERRVAELAASGSAPKSSETAVVRPASTNVTSVRVADVVEPAVDNRTAGNSSTSTQSTEPEVPQEPLWDADVLYNISLISPFVWKASSPASKSVQANPEDVMLESLRVINQSLWSFDAKVELVLVVQFDGKVDVQLQQLSRRLVGAPIRLVAAVSSDNLYNTGSRVARGDLLYFLPSVEEFNHFEEFEHVKPVIAPKPAGKRAYSAGQQASKRTLLSVDVVQNSSEVASPEAIGLLDNVGANLIEKPDAVGGGGGGGGGGDGPSVADNDRQPAVAVVNHTAIEKVIPEALSKQDDGGSPVVPSTTGTALSVLFGAR